MEFKPKPGAEPWAGLERTSERLGRGRARLPLALAETPPRDGPFEAPSQEIARLYPPRTRKGRRAQGEWFTLTAPVQRPVGRPPKGR